ncbi:serine/threonine-protein kinase [Actinomycetospora callitridis]|uniref:serine/threonine-protein kinase n=1 Tax=Actinomycetospora callitridis TaxID=913944 RepID=UPI002365DA23|nr:serine/threonine-protein kinase [Actinomycetospora callitridis]MDD7918729.1 serine/threonine-protein kinase [Actinomycetospora callitridis]
MSTPTTMLSDAVTLEPGHLVAGRYLLLARVGRGGSGSVWRAHDKLLDRDVAIKRLHAGRALTDVHTRKIRDRAHREGRVAARLHHPRLAAIYDMTELDGEVCLVMEYVAAPSLADLLERRGPLRAARVAAIGAQIAEGLTAMHRCGIVHRDVKPANVMVGPGDTVTVTDFGIAIIHADLGEDDHLVAGTPNYMAPEVACGDAPTAAADMYSLGATLHAALEGAPPRPGAGHVLDVPEGVRVDAGQPPRRRERLDAVLNTLLDHDPQRRPSADAVARLLTGASGADAPGDATTWSSPVGRSAPSTTMALTPEDAGRTPAATPGAGRHRAALTARWRSSRRVVAVGASLVGVLGAAGFLTLAHGPAPAAPVASPVVGPASAPPSAGPPIVPLTPSTATSTPVEEVASAAPPSSVSSRGTTAQAAGSGDDDLDPPGDERRGRGGGHGGEDKHDNKGNGPKNGRGHGR